jgi:hypothetical protein
LSLDVWLTLRDSGWDTLPLAEEALVDDSICLATLLRQSS